MDSIDPREMARALADIPLFREFQAVLRAGGPANWEIGSQIALAIAKAGPPDIPPIGEETSFAEACRLAELTISQATGLEPPHVLTSVKVVDRVQWAQIYLERFRPMIDRLATALRRELGDPIPIAGAARFLDALGSFAMGAQVGFLIGHLSHETTAQYEVWLPEAKSDVHIFVGPNVARVKQELEADPNEFRLWLALHEVSRELELESIGWARSHLLELIGQYVDAVEVDVFSAAERLQSLQDPDELARLIEHPHDLLPLAHGEAQQRAGDRLRALVAVLEGYGDRLMRKAGEGLLGEFDKISEGMVRRRAERSSASKMLGKLLGIELENEHYRAGRRFVEEVEQAGKLEYLLGSPSALPTMEEIAHPAEWLKRVPFS